MSRQGYRWDEIFRLTTLGSALGWEQWDYMLFFKTITKIIAVIDIHTNSTYLCSTGSSTTITVEASLWRGLVFDWQELLGRCVSVPKMARHILMARSLELWVRRGPSRVWLSQLRPLHQDSLWSSRPFLLPPQSGTVRSPHVPANTKRTAQAPHQL